ncbi:MAG TPA: pirin family protein [Verrucomicrobiae bacterium]|jgi:redox-sensitive bicupin YhaK (pirin superfamily)|nr:pirin family protein [Verrucomicrobiae bacterium]
MITLRPSRERGHFAHGWLDTYHSFSFADYHDPEHMGFRKLRVINEDKVAPGEGFPPHSHQNMEIITYILQGGLQHKDSMGNTSVIRPGEVQRMSAGTGVTHSEYNPSPKEPVHLLQIWIYPGRPGLQPGYEQKLFEPSGKKNKLRLVASPDGRDGSVTVHQNACMYDAAIEPGKSVKHAPEAGHGQWIQITHGELKLNGQKLGPGDGAAVEGEKALTFESDKGAEFILFDLE